jgi:hypothetical protein
MGISVSHNFNLPPPKDKNSFFTQATLRTAGRSRSSSSFEDLQNPKTIFEKGPLDSTSRWKFILPGFNPILLLFAPD